MRTASELPVHLLFRIIHQYVVVFQPRTVSLLERIRNILPTRNTRKKAVDAGRYAPFIKPRNTRKGWMRVATLDV